MLTATPRGRVSTLVDYSYILTLSKDLIVEPGHKESTTLKDEEEFIKNIVG